MDAKELKDKFKEIDNNCTVACENFPLSVRDFKLEAIFQQNVALAQFLSEGKKEVNEDDNE